MDSIELKYHYLKKRYKKLKNAYKKYNHMVHQAGGTKRSHDSLEYKELEHAKVGIENSGDLALDFMNISDIENLFNTRKNLPIKDNIFILKKNIDFSDTNTREKIKNMNVKTFIVNSEENFNVIKPIFD